MQALKSALLPWLLLIALAFGGLKLLAVQVEAKNVALERVSTLEREAKALRDSVSTMRQKVTLSNTDAQTARLELNRALDQVPEAAAAHVPAAVVDSLCQRLRCVKPGPVPAPAG